MKKATLTLITVVGLSACTIEATDTTTPAPRPAPITTPNTTPAINVDDVFVDTVLGEYPETAAAFTRSELIAFGHTLCDAIDGGMTMEDMALMVLAEGADPEQVGYIAGAAVVAYCSWNADWIG